MSALTEARMKIEVATQEEWDSVLPQPRRDNTMSVALLWMLRGEVIKFQCPPHIRVNSSKNGSIFPVRCRIQNQLALFGQRNEGKWASKHARDGKLLIRRIE